MQGSTYCFIYCEVQLLYQSNQFENVKKVLVTIRAQIDYIASILMTAAYKIFKFSIVKNSCCDVIVKMKILKKKLQT